MISLSFPSSFISSMSVQTVTFGGPNHCNIWDFFLSPLPPKQIFTTISLSLRMRVSEMGSAIWGIMRVFIKVFWFDGEVSRPYCSFSMRGDCPQKRALKKPNACHTVLSTHWPQGWCQGLNSLQFKLYLFSPLPHFMFVLGELSLVGGLDDPYSLLLMGPEPVLPLVSLGLSDGQQANVDQMAISRALHGAVKDRWFRELRLPCMERREGSWRRVTLRTQRLGCPKSGCLKPRE